MLEYAINAIKVEFKVIKIQLENEIFVLKSQAQAKSLFRKPVEDKHS